MNTDRIGRPMQHKPPPSATKFIELLAELEGGVLLKDLTAYVNELQLACADTLKKGKLKLTFDFEPNMRGQTEISVKVVRDIPQHDRNSTMFFSTPEGALMRDDPKQERLPFAPVPREPLTVVGRKDLDD